MRAAGLEAWKDGVRSVAPHAAPVLDQVSDFEELTFASYYDVVLPRWHGHRVAILGDAAHATSPQLGQGCNLALCDASALADAVASEPSVPRALERYTAARRDHLAFYQLATLWLTPFFQSDFELLGTVRDLLAGAGRRSAAFVPPRDGSKHGRDQDGDLRGVARRARMPGPSRRHGSPLPSDPS